MSRALRVPTYRTFNENVSAVEKKLRSAHSSGEPFGGGAFRLEDALASVDAGRMPHVFPVDGFPSESAGGTTVGENGEHVGSGFNQD